MRLYDLARGLGENEVVPARPSQSISVEGTFKEDVLLPDTEPMIWRLAEKLWSASRDESQVPRTVVRYTPGRPPASCDELTEIVLKLRERVNLSSEQRYRPVGVGLSNFREGQEAASPPVLFE